MTNYLYDTVTVTYNNGYTSGTVNLYINGVVKSSCGANQTKTYTQKYVPGDILRIEEGFAELGANLIITLSNANIVNRYNINFPVNTTVDFNKENNSNEIHSYAFKHFSYQEVGKQFDEQYRIVLNSKIQ